MAALQEDKAAVDSLTTSGVSSPASGISGQRLQCFKTKRCRFWLEGRCTRGDRCTYAHTDVELRIPPDLTKTKICTRWKRGICESSVEECAYAHGPEDLRIPSPLRAARARENLYEKKASSTPLTGRSIATMTSIASTACSGREADSSEHLLSSGLYEKSGSSSTLYGGDDDDEGSDFVPSSHPMLTPRPMLQSALRHHGDHPVCLPSPLPSPQTSAVVPSSRRRIEDDGEEGDDVPRLGSMHCDFSVGNYCERSPLGSFCYEPASASPCEPFCFELSGDRRLALWQALLKSLTDPYSD